MRPIWIKIKGLNSFLEPQEIDFQELTGEGLFGIFGADGKREKQYPGRDHPGFIRNHSQKQHEFYSCEYRQSAGRLYFFCKDKGNPYLPGDQRI